MISCENDFCIYWQENLCSLSTIAVSSDGHCRECILVSLSEEELSRKRTEALSAFAKRHCQWADAE